MPRAKRTRDYRAEERRRNELARAAGFRNRAEQRRALRNREPVVRNKRGTVVGRAQGPAQPEYARAGYSSQGAYDRERRESREWSSRHSQQETSRYKAGMTPREAHSYYNAYVNMDTKASITTNELFSLREYLVDVMGYYTNDEFDDRYL